MEEYQALQHMESVDATRSSDINSYYMPHHGVIRESSVTKKLRVVFNASQKTAADTSLNECLHTGPALQQDLNSVVMKWRNHQFVCNADIEKMYRQIRIHPEDADLQRIVWRASPSDPMTCYRLTTVMYGTAAAPYLAIRTLQQLAEAEQARFPLGAEALRNDFYVDDALFGADDIATAQKDPEAAD
ncbi:uncharacterized protein LOC105701086 [Orussus abietinus]|uniref:uncharacterized protein LOC105701086 n=1 Tax=Orussus abietinus TaxID=222816 RepID=UPI000625E4BB|nr:uncharacterized protein LOC105701086 [Orussus abietinus]